MEKKTYYMVRNREIEKFHTCMCSACLLLGGSIRYDKMKIYFDLPENITWHRLVMRTYVILSRWSFGDLMRRKYILHDDLTHAYISFYRPDDGAGFNYYVYANA